MIDYFNFFEGTKSYSRLLEARALGFSDLTHIIHMVKITGQQLINVTYDASSEGQDIYLRDHKMTRTAKDMFTG